MVINPEANPDSYQSAQSPVRISCQEESSLTFSSQTMCTFPQKLPLSLTSHMNAFTIIILSFGDGSMLLVGRLKNTSEAITKSLWNMSLRLPSALGSSCCWIQRSSKLSPWRTSTSSKWLKLSSPFLAKKHTF